MTHRFMALLPPALLTGCGGPQSMLSPRGPEAAGIAEVWWVMFWGAVAVMLLVMALVLAPLGPGKRRALSPRLLIIGGGLLLPVITLSLLLIHGYRLGAAHRTGDTAALRIQVIGHRFWWEVRYPDQPGAVSANEIRFPAGQPVELELTSRDAIHSLWIPNLAGKLDLIPGKVNRLGLQADQPGLYRGQCAEFCGLHHARMALVVEAMPAEDFQRWLQGLAAPAPAPRTEAARRGEAAFSHHCAGCHQVRGGPGQAGAAPDLTHLADRRSLRSGWPPQAWDLQRWWLDSHLSAPEARALSDSLAAGVRADLADYLEGPE